MRALGKRELAAEERLQLLRLLVRPHGDHPVPELVDLVTPGPDGTDALEPILGLYSITDHSGFEDSVRLRLRFPVLSQRLHKTTFLLEAKARMRDQVRTAARQWQDRARPDSLPMVVAGDSEGQLRFWDTTTGRPLWTLPAHRSHVVGVHFEGGDIVTRGFSGDLLALGGLIIKYQIQRVHPGVNEPNLAFHVALGCNRGVSSRRAFSLGI